MDILSNLASGMAQAATPENLMYCFLGVTLGTFIGVLPGLGAMIGIALLLPVTYYLDPASAIIMLAGIYYGGEYGGSIAAILINVPGTPSSAVTSIDGHAMTKQGRAAVALFMTAIASFVGGSIGIVLLTAFSPLIAAFALTFSSVDYFAVMLLGLVASASVARGSALKGIVAVIAGVLIGTIGTDVSTGAQRFTMGVPELVTGVNLVVLAMGIFGFAEIVASAGSQLRRTEDQSIRMRDMLPDRGEARRSVMPIARGSSLGSLLGALPGAGPTLSAFLAYSFEKSISRNKAFFGSGIVEGVVSPESANNAAAQTAFIPTFTLGIPGTATMALILGALMIHGLSPGPRLMTDNADLFWAVVASFWIGNVFLLVLNIPLVTIWVRLLRIPYRFLFPAIICFICVGVYSVSLNPVDIFIVLAVGLLGYAMRLTGFEAAPLLMGFILGPLMEEYLRRALLLGRGDFRVFLESPISATCLAITAAMIAWPAIRSRLGRRHA
ncbi:hypothetical protein C2I36_08320 [Rhodobacteraceae bacterium WD3A24]|nr:hypothetical protein C2I36_08320 [Rhodobacteraceae bacterium WD3A24]